MRETITVQVGQCGNQIGSLFWQLLLLEHEKTPDTDAALSAYFRFAPSGTCELVKLSNRTNNGSKQLMTFLLLR
jgi:hypothetical protein